MYAYPNLAATSRDVQPAIDNLLQVALQTLAEVLEHGRAAGEDNILSEQSEVVLVVETHEDVTHLVEPSPDING